MNDSEKPHVVAPGAPLAARKHPIQHIAFDGKGVVRFVQNEIVRHLLDVSPHDLNKLACMDFCDEDREQLSMLTGYSVGGFNDLDFASDETCEAANEATTALGVSARASGFVPPVAGAEAHEEEDEADSAAPQETLIEQAQRHLIETLRLAAESNQQTVTALLKFNGRMEREIDRLSKENERLRVALPTIKAS